jgi:hypothetical protein
MLIALSLGMQASSSNRAHLIIKAHRKLIFIKSLSIVALIIVLSQYMLLEVHWREHLKTLGTLNGQCRVDHCLTDLE